MTFPKKIKYFFIRKAAKVLILSIIKTCKFKVTGFEHVEKAREQKKPIIYVYWHRHIFVTIYRFRNSGARPLISLSEDGEIVAQIALEFGMNPVRGSSSKGGARAFLKLADAIKADNSEVMITADGPKGPVREIKDGTILLAQKTGSVIVPIAWHADRLKILEKSWDKFKIALPFGSITYAYGEPFTVPPDAPKEDFPQLKKSLKKAIDTLEKEVENKE
ncbi:MAG: lysophospholipid acyltransferase family protein [bacterium]|nr:lysophospholipid acyltransferase family protein [bacterium]